MNNQSLCSYNQEAYVSRVPAADNEFDFPDTIYDKHLKEISGIKFTSREAEVMAFILSGRSGKKISSLLSISQKTVENHTYNIMKKLQCNSREGIIDFIEKSGRYLIVKQYYLSLLIHTEFEKILNNIAFAHEGATCSLIHWSLQESSFASLPYFKAHLATAGIKITEETRRKWESVSSLLCETPRRKRNIYLLPQCAWEDYQCKPSDGSIDFGKLFIFPAKKSLDKLPIELSANCFDLSKHKNYYLLVFEILKRLLPKQSIEKMVVAFQERVVALSNISDLKKAYFNPYEQKRFLKSPSRFTVQSQKYSALFFWDYA